MVQRGVGHHDESITLCLAFVGGDVLGPPLGPGFSPAAAAESRFEVALPPGFLPARCCERT